METPIKERSKFDQGLLSQHEKALDAVQELTFEDEDALALQVISVRLLERGHAILLAASDAAQGESESERVLLDALREGEGRCERAYAACYYGLEALKFEAQSQRRDGETARITRGFTSAGGLSPSVFEALGATRTLTVMRALLPVFIQRFAADDARLIELREALAGFEVATTEANRVIARATQALTDLQRARDDAKRFYVAARQSLDAALRLEGSGDDLNRFIAPVTAIYDHTRRAASEEPAAGAS